MHGTDPARVMMPPPLYLHTIGDGDPIDVANRLATEGADPGLVVWQTDMQLLRMAVLLCPDKADAPLTILAALALAEALEADGPPQMHMALAVDGAFFLNGAVLGHITARWPDQGLAEDGGPDWAVIGITVRVSGCGSVIPAEPGRTPDQTSLGEEGFDQAGDGTISVADLLQRVAHHLRYWLSVWDEDGASAIISVWARRQDRWKRLGLGEARDDGR